MSEIKYRDVKENEIIKKGDEYDRCTDSEWWRPGWHEFGEGDIGKKRSYFQGWAVRRPVENKRLQELKELGVSQQTIDKGLEIIKGLNLDISTLSFYTDITEDSPLQISDPQAGFWIEVLVWKQ